jgi:hypothetical protein
MRIVLVLLLFPVTALSQSCNWACEARKAEVHLLKPGVAERHGDRLVLVTGPGKQVFDDNKKACDDGNAKDCAIFSLVATAPGSLAVEKFEFEGSDTYLIDTPTGRKTMLTGVPVFSLDGREFVVTDFSNESENTAEVWRREGDNAKLEWAQPFQQTFAKDFAILHGPAPVIRAAPWQGDHIALKVSTDDLRYHWTGSLIRDSKGWHLSAKSPPGLLPQPGISAKP